jgi:hypothetical protein
MSDELQPAMAELSRVVKALLHTPLPSTHAGPRPQPQRALRPLLRCHRCHVPPASVRAVKSPTTSPTCSTACCRTSPHSHPSTPAATQPFYQQPHRRITILRHEVQTAVTRSHLGDAAREPAGELRGTRQRGKPGMKCGLLLLGVVKALLQQRVELPATFLQLQISSVLLFSSMASTRVLRRRR